MTATEAKQADTALLDPHPGSAPQRLRSFQPAGCWAQRILRTLQLPSLGSAPPHRPWAQALPPLEMIQTQNDVSFYACCLAAFHSSVKSLLRIPAILSIYGLFNPCTPSFFYAGRNPFQPPSCTTASGVALPAGWTHFGSHLPRQSRGNASPEVIEEKMHHFLILRSLHTKTYSSHVR